MNRWVLYIAESILAIIALSLTIVAWIRQVEGWQQNIIIAGAAVCTLVLSTYLSVLAIQAGGDILPSAKYAVLTHVVLIVWLLSLCVIMGSRLWKRGK